MKIMFKHIVLPVLLGVGYWYLTSGLFEEPFPLITTVILFVCGWNTTEIIKWLLK
jgi:hypothetical protein